MNSAPPTPLCRRCAVGLSTLWTTGASLDLDQPCMRWINDTECQNAVNNRCVVSSQMKNERIIQIKRNGADASITIHKSTASRRDLNEMMKCSPKEKNNCLLREDKPDLRLVRTNYCVPGMMSRCSAGLVWNDQKRCKYAVRSTVREGCMYYIEAIGGHCDCVEAQRDLGNVQKKGRRSSQGLR